MAQKQDPHPRRKGSVVWATVLSWLSSLLLALLALCLVLMTTICSASYMKEQVNRSDFSEAAYSYLYGKRIRFLSLLIYPFKNLQALMFHGFWRFSHFCCHAGNLRRFP